jgi:hypothetical protein
MNSASGIDSSILWVICVLNVQCMQSQCTILWITYVWTVHLFWFPVDEVYEYIVGLLLLPVNGLSSGT